MGSRPQAHSPTIQEPNPAARNAEMPGYPAAILALSRQTGRRFAQHAGESVVHARLRVSPRSARGPLARRGSHPPFHGRRRCRRAGRSSASRQDRASCRREPFRRGVRRSRARRGRALRATARGHRLVRATPGRPRPGLLRSARSRCYARPRRGQPKDVAKPVDRRTVEKVEQRGERRRSRVRPACRLGRGVRRLVGYDERHRPQEICCPVQAAAGGRVSQVRSRG